MARTRRIHRAVSGSILLIAGCLTMTASDAQDRPPEVVFAAENRGRVLPCESCTEHGSGGLAHRAARYASLSAEFPNVVFIDGGNSLFGGEGVGSDGEVVVRALDAMGLDLANISYRDFRPGRDRVLSLLSNVSFEAVSANLRREETGELLFRPYSIRPVGGVRWGFLGLTERPVSLPYVAELREQLAGVTIEPPRDALARVVPALREITDRRVLIYYGSALSLSRALEGFAEAFDLVLVGGQDWDRLPPGRNWYGSGIEGRTLTRLSPDGVGWKETRERIGLSDETAGDEVPTAVTDVLLEFGFESPSAPTEDPGARSDDVPPLSLAERLGRATGAGREPQGLSGVGLTPRQVDAAIDRGRAYLWARIQSEGGLTAASPREHVVVAYALATADAERRIPGFREQVRAFLEAYSPGSDTYQLGILAMLADHLGDPLLTPHVGLWGQRLLDGQYDDGAWQYHSSRDPRSVAPETNPLSVTGGHPGRIRREQPVVRTKDWGARPKGGDNSVSQFAVLGLRSVERRVGEVTEESWRRATELFRTRQRADGGWAYNAGGSSYGSMTCAGVCSLAIARHALGESEPLLDEAIVQGVEWLAREFAAENPGKDDHHLYWLYSVERVGRLLEIDFLGEHEWYPVGARYLIECQQADGRWESGLGHEKDARVATSFALLFLTRSTETLVPAPPSDVGAGILRTVFEADPPERVYAILDASGSMRAKLDGRPKFDAARDALEGLIQALPGETEIALRVYGHRRTALDKRADEDTELTVPFPGDRKRLFSALAGLGPKGKTPIARSLQEATRDLRSPAKGRTLVLLLTDGGDDTTGRRDANAAAATLAKLRETELHVVGFDIQRDSWLRELEGLATEGRGKFWRASDSDTIAATVRSAVTGQPEPFVVRDASGAELARGTFGESVTLPVGRYTLSTTFADQNLETTLTIDSGTTTAVTFRPAWVR